MDFSSLGEAKEFRRVAKGGGQTILDASRRGGEKFWTRPEGGAKNFGRVAKGGRKISDLIYFFRSLKFNVFWSFYGFWGNFKF